MYIDPNSVMVNGNEEPRGINQENLVMFVNLEADIVPRSTLISDDDKNTLKSIAKGTLNFLSSGSGGGDFTTDWTESFVPSTSKDKEGNATLTSDQFTDTTGQSFGIDNISILVKGMNFIPQININFIDVRGKTLFESPENSPYQAFFHIPWPIFYLTVKGFYGKAIRYRLHLIKFNSKYNESNGNFEISTSFVGSSFAFMNDIPLKGLLNAPYMFLKESTKLGEFNESTGKSEQKVFKSSKGYAILNSVYSEMKRKKLIPQDFPVKTVREIGAIAETLDKVLEQKIFKDVIDMRVLAGLQDYDKILTNFYNSIKKWSDSFLNKTPFEDRPKGKNESGQEIFVRYYGLKSQNKSDSVNIVGKDNTNTLEGIINVYTKELKNSSLFNNDLQKTGPKSIKVNVSFLSKNLSKVQNYYELNERGELVVAIDKLFEDLGEIRGTFFEQKQKIEKEVEKKMNEVVKDPKSGIGFEPTVRNLFAVLLANAEVYVRLMKEVHQDAFNVAVDRKENLKGFDDETKGESIYPWPEIKRTLPTDKKKVIAYPGEPELREKLQSNNPILWPEVAFVEEYLAVSTNKNDPNTEKEGGVNNINYIFESDLDDSRINQVSSFFDVSGNIPYSDRTLVSFLYELQERAKIMTFVDSFSSDSIKELVKIEFETISEVMSEESDIIDILNTTIKTPDDLFDMMFKLSPFERNQYYKDSIPTQSYIKDLLDSPFNIKQYDSSKSKSPKKENLYDKLNVELLNYTPEPYRKNIYPFNSDLYTTYLDKPISDNDFKFKGVLQVRQDKGFVTTPISPYSWIKDGYRDTNTNVNLFTQSMSFEKHTEHILNTPYFHKQLYRDFARSNPYSKYVGSAYLLINSLPFLELTDTIKFTTEDSKEILNGSTFLPPIRVSSLFREISSTQFIPYHLIVKWGSLYHRYKRKILDNVDILDGFLDSNGITTNINANLFFNSGNNSDGFNIFPNGFSPSGLVPTPSGATYSNSVDVGIHPYYDAIYHQVINGYNHYNVLSGNTSYFGNVLNGSINTRGKRKENGLTYWTSFVDNSKFNPTDLRYTVLPSVGDNKNLNFNNTDTFSRGNQIYYSTIWDNNPIVGDYSGKTFFKYDEYNTNISGDYSIDSNKKKVIDLISTFSPLLLEQFEEIFLQFSTEKLNEEKPYKKFQKVKYDNFQDLLKGLLSVKKESTDNGKSFEEIVDLIKTRQSENKVRISKEILEYDNLLEIKLGNPKELDPYIIEGFVDIAGNTLTFNKFNESTDLVNLKYINLYVGEDIDGHYLDFFKKNNIELNEENVLKFRPLIFI
jgi:hypothetical protein